MSVRVSFQSWNPAGLKLWALTSGSRSDHGMLYWFGLTEASFPLSHDIFDMSGIFFFSPSTSSLPFIHQWPLYAMVVQVKVHQPEILSYKMLQKKTIKLFRGGLTLPEGRVYKIGFLARALYTLVANVMSRMEWMACSISMTDYAECWCSHSQLWPKKSHWKYEFSQAKTRTAPFSALRCRVTACTLQTLIHAWLFENCSEAWIKWALLPG